MAETERNRIKSILEKSNLPEAVEVSGRSIVCTFTDKILITEEQFKSTKIIMVDITKCSTEDCPLESTCYRKQAISDPYRQAYGNFPVVNNNCNFYMLEKSLTVKEFHLDKKGIIKKSTGNPFKLLADSYIPLEPH